ncbi:MAG: molybdopterin molybdotransferase MoeA [Bacteroidales bacterium]|nr:molybdopterin molybdotransferase MoeA [Bacteroidales bacterium]
MITHSEALKIVLKTDFQTKIEKIDVKNSIGRVLASDIISSINMPPFNKSMVDGYACLKSDIDNELIVDKIIGAGDNDQYIIEHGHCIKIMTGAPVPKNAEIVVMVEDVEVTSSNTIIINNQNSSENISPLGEDIRLGDKVLEKSTLLKPFHCGILASLGYDKVDVFAKPKVGIIVTGDEIIEPGNKLKSGQIYNSNAYQLINNCKTIGIDAEYYGIAVDTYEDIKNAFNSMKAKNDVVIITGGVSMGDYDYVAPILKESELNVWFDSIAAQPGRPLVYAENGNKFCFGMPGNPVSGLVLFETIVKPFLYKIMGHDFKPNVFKLKLDSKISRKKAKRKSYYPVKLNNDNSVAAIEYHGSAHLNSYVQAWGIVFLDQGVYEIEEGSDIDVRQI